MADRKPHLLHVSIDWFGNEGISYEIECPYDDLGDKRPCALWEECEHRHPEEPESPYPTIKRWQDGEPEFGSGVSEKDAAEWLAYWKASDEYVETHPNGSWESTNDCWIRHYVQEGGYEDGWTFAKDFKQEVMGPVPVEGKNVGEAFDDTSLVLAPWKESDGE